MTGTGTRAWKRKQREELLTRGRVSGYEGHHIVNVKSNPGLAGDPRNIVFVSAREHKLVHGKNFQNNTKGRGIDRAAMMKDHANKAVKRTIVEAEARAASQVKLQPEQAKQLAEKVEGVTARLKPGMQRLQKMAKWAGVAEDIKEFIDAHDK